MTSCSFACSFSVQRVLCNWLDRAAGAPRESSVSSNFHIFFLSLFSFLFFFNFVRALKVLHVQVEMSLLTTYLRLIFVRLLANCIVGVIEIAKAGKHSSRCSPRPRALSHNFPAHARTPARPHACNKQTRRTCRRTLSAFLSVHAEAQGQRALMLPGFVGERARMLSIGCH